MKPPRLSKAQWGLLRNLPDSNTGKHACPYGPAVNTARSLVARRLVYMSGRYAWRSPAGRALVEAEDKRIAEEVARELDRYLPRPYGWSP